MRLPNFLIIGAHKAGTTSLYHYLKSHPQIFMPELKEARYFAYNPQNPEHIKKAHSAFPVITMEEYLELFENVKDESVIGEASPNYLTSEYAANNIYRNIPNAKLIVSLRNPIDRAYSLFQMNYRSGNSQAEDIRNFKFCLEDAKKNAYYPKLKSYFDLFENNQIKIILFEELVNDRERIVKEIFRFLNVSDSYMPLETGVHNRGGIPKSKSIYNISKNRLLKKMLKAYMPHSIISMLKKIKDGNMKKAPKLTDEIRREYIKLVKEDIIDLENLIKRDLTSWYEI